MADEPEILPADAVARIRFPKEIFTQAYLDDEIRFAPDPRFNAETAIRQVTTTPVVSRDLGDYLAVDINSKEPIAFPISMYSKLINRFAYDRVVDRTFRSFPRRG
jgi:hypothetical protein